MKTNLLERFDSQIAICSAIGITATMAAPQQEAEAVDYVYYQPNGGAGWVVPNTLEGLYINVQTQVTGTTSGSVPGWDLNPYTTGGGSGLSWFRSSTSGSAYMRFPGDVSSFNPGNLDFGTIVGASASFSTVNINSTVFGPGVGQWKLNSPNYLGYRFIGGDSQQYYGWLRIDVGPNAETRTIMEVGYSTVTGQSVQVGAVPEPSTVIMGLLASGATGVIAWRRRRQTA